MQPGDLPSNFHTARRHFTPSVKFSVAGRPSVNCCQLSMRPGDLPSTSVKLQCDQEIICELSANFHAAGRPSVNFRQHFVWSGDSVKCHQLSVQPGDLLSTYVNILCCQETFHQLPSTFCAAGRPSINFVIFPCGWGPSVNFCQRSVQPGDLLSTYVNILCCQETFHQLPSTFCAAGRPSINFVIFPCGWETFR